MRLPLLLLIAAAACRTTSTSRAPRPDSVPITRTAPTKAWELWDAGRCLGSLVRFEEPSNPRRAFYSVRNREGQELGLVDLDGRAWRYRPHESVPQWVGTGTVLEGARRILDGTAAAELVEVGVGTLKDLLQRRG